jgi:hypothetical protein
MPRTQALAVGTITIPSLALTSDEVQMIWVSCGVPARYPAALYSQVRPGVTSRDYQNQQRPGAELPDRQSVMPG